MMKDNPSHIGKDVNSKNKGNRRKRLRSSTTRTINSPTLIAFLIAYLNAISFPVSGLVSSDTPRSLVGQRIYASRSAEAEAVLTLKPKVSAISQEKRDETMKAIAKTKVDTALEGVDAQVLEMLSDQFLFPSSNGAQNRKPPRGRPDSVAGAMKYETILKLREKNEREDRFGYTTSSLPYHDSAG